MTWKWSAVTPRFSTKASSYIARVSAERNMMSAITIYRPENPDFQNNTGKLIADPGYLIYEGKARVWTVQGPITMGIGDEPTYYSSTMVSIPLEDEDPFSSPASAAPQSPRVDDIIQIVRHADLLMRDRYFRVTDVEAGGEFPASRKMQCVGIQASKQWGTPQIPQEWIVR